MTSPIVEAARAWRDARIACLKAYADGSNTPEKERIASFLALGEAEWALSDAVKAADRVDVLDAPGMR